jgi:hypothetical protein
MIPLRPSAWTLTDSKLFGTVANGNGSETVDPSELVVLGATPVSDFDVSFTVDPTGFWTFLFGMTSSGFDSIVFRQGTTFVRRSSEARPICTQLTPDLAQPQMGGRRLRIRRLLDDVHLDLSADGSNTFSCTTPNAEAGFLAFGIISGSASITDFEIQSAASP